MTHYDPLSQRRWITIGIACGFAAMIDYPLIILVDLPTPVGVFMAAAFGFLLALAAIGLKNLIELHKPSVIAQIGALCVTIGGSIVGAMMLVQVAVNMHMRQLMAATTDAAAKETFRQFWLAIDKVQLGLDVTWDFFGGVGTLLLAFAAIRHPRFGWWFAGPGIVLATALLVLNFWTFPIPPGESSLIDLGPFVAMWYVAMTIRAAMSLKWVGLQLQEA